MALDNQPSAHPIYIFDKVSDREFEIRRGFYNFIVIKIKDPDEFRD